MLEPRAPKRPDFQSIMEDLRVMMMHNPLTNSSPIQSRVEAPSGTVYMVYSVCFFIIIILFIIIMHSIKLLNKNNKK